MRDARIAGNTAATIVTPVPTTNDQTKAFDGIVIPLAGMSTPSADSSPLSTPASSTPPTNPMTDATRPTSAASKSTERTTWPLLAPMARSRAISRLRWATMIEKVLKMMKEPTSSAMTPKTSRKVLKKLSADLMSFWLSFVISEPVSTSMFLSPASDRLRFRATCACETPESALTRISSTLPG